MRQFTFPNGVTVGCYADIDVHLDAIATLRVGAVLESVAPYLSGEAALIVFSESAEEALGLPPDPLRRRMRDRTAGGEAMWFDTAPNRVSLSIEFPPMDDADEVESMMRRSASSWRSLHFESTTFRSHSEGDEIEVTFTPDVGVEMRELARDCMRVIASVRGTMLSVDSPHGAMQSLLSHAWESFRGVPESSWLEAKAKLWGVDSAAGQFELALDVASFANSPAGGVIVVGFTTTRDEFDRDVITNVDGIRNIDAAVPRVEEIINRYITPHPRDLRVEVIERGDHRVLVVYIPPQPAEHLPHLVLGGTLATGKYFGGGFSWVERRGTSKRSVSLAEVQQLLRTNRAPGATPPN